MKGLYLKSYSFRMGLEPQKSYSMGEGWGASGFLGLNYNPLIRNKALLRDIKGLLGSMVIHNPFNPLIRPPYSLGWHDALDGVEPLRFPSRWI